MGSNGEAIYSPLITPGTADMVIALEPGEAARALPYLAPGGVLVTATTAIHPVTAALASQPYRAGDVVAALANSLQAEASREQAAESIVAPNTVTADQDASTDGVEGYPVPLFIPVDDEALVREAGAPEGIDIRSYDVVGIYSPSEVKVLIEQFGDELPTIAAFGEATLRCAIEAGLTVKIKAPTPEAPSMVKAIDIYIDQVHAGKEVEAAQFVEDKQKEEFIRSQQHKLAKKSRARRSSADKK